MSAATPEPVVKADSVTENSYQVVLNKSEINSIGVPEVDSNNLRNRRTPQNRESR